MAKNVIKEIIIILLLCLAIILILGILLYEYVPTSKTVPNPVSYVRTETIEEELASSDSIDESQVVMTYEINSSDLNNYKQMQEYKPGKANPFAASSTDDTGNSNGSNSSNTSSGSTSTGTGSNNSTSEGYYPDKGIK